MKLAILFVTLSLTAIFGQVYAPAPIGRGHVYIAGERDPRGGYTGFYKVGGTGMTKNLRRSTLNTGNPRQLHMLVFTRVARTRDTERAIRSSLARWRVYYGGGREWFHVPRNQWNTFYSTYRNAIRRFG